LELTPG